MNDTPSPIEVQKHLSGVDYPATKDELLRAAEVNGADDDIIDLLDGLDDRTYESPADVSEELGS
ncbi:DUF2795 domain-containing protein [Ruicaihuangia caeni]|uniref:DUF2795 domain-containing protein n=1 Tax=Ruicaihuangia caeni TaxID=3042517 RepID=A0AAW6TA59_9MICO|nr:DUF2795 domain-containing protein [Klugiella sp. YN-L-19]MDI2099223.1 DUF2795 domain-containing protein [Klugiella sp. YN-L-19]